MNDADSGTDMRVLATELRTKVFAEVPCEVAMIVSSDTINKSYLSGYVSMAHDLAPTYRSAVLASRDGASLVVSAADAGPALDLLGDPDLLYRYGVFHFATAALGPAGFGRPASTGFEDAFVEALRTLRPASGIVGVDRTNDDLVWNLCREMFGDRAVIDVTLDIARARATKTTGEVARLRTAARLIENGFRWVIENARAGMTEFDLTAGITGNIVAGGGIPRFVSVTTGSRSALADAYPTRRTIAKGEMIRIDAGCTVDGYWSDIARTFVFGEPDARQRRIYEALRVGLDEELAAVRAGIAANELFGVAVEAVRTNGLPEYRRQHCGHGIGLRSYDSPLINPTDATPLVEGMCLCLETPYYELGVDGMMVEDTVCVTATGHESLMTMPRELFILP
ncbi:M24 family metallopeptidase [Labrys okinawensis]|uniref:M24 family metallopeptidase n=1 Tax=Labrys okinawensis TaxID=346911 RepID=UPI0015E2C1FB|nr:Xaa-Pro peptidase family protein [Labrys okinawensis]